MKDFTFKAPTLFAPAALPSDALRDALHDAPGTAAHLAKFERFATWLKSELRQVGIAASGPSIDEGGWIVEAPSTEGFVVCIISGPDGNDPIFHVLVDEIGGATEEVGDAVEAILRNASEITDLTISA